MITHHDLIAALSYNPETGEFHWRANFFVSKVGSRAGFKSSRGYRRIKIKGEDHREHRLAWFYVFGTWPSLEIDHIDRCRDNNRIANLRLATRSQNQNNIPSRNGAKVDLKGVAWHKSARKYQAQIYVNGVLKYLGLFPTKEEAHAAYAKVAVTHHGEFLCGVAAT